MTRPVTPSRIGATVVALALALLLVTPASAADLSLVYHRGDDLAETLKRVAGPDASIDDLLAHNGLSSGQLPAPGTSIVVPEAWLQPWSGSNAEILFVRGDVRVETGDSRSLAVGIGARLLPGDVVVTGADGAASLRLFGAEDAPDHDHVQVRSDSRLEIGQLFVSKEGGFRAGAVRLLKGAVDFVTSGSTERRRQIEVETPTIIGGVRGTGYRVVIEGDEAASTRVETLEGTVFSAAEADEVAVAGGFGSRGNEGEPPGAPTPLLAGPSLSSPASGATLESFVFLWSEVPGAVSYVVEIALEPEFARIVYRATPDLARHDPVDARLPEQDTPYWWRVSAVDGDDFQGMNSEAGSFVLP